MYSTPEFSWLQDVVHPQLDVWHTYKNAVDTLFITDSIMCTLIAPYMHYIAPNGKIFPGGSALSLEVKVYTYAIIYYLKYLIRCKC